MAQTTLQKLNAERKYRRELQLEIIELKANVRTADERAKDADLEAAKAIRRMDNTQLDLTKVEGDLQNAKLELATLRGYTQRVNQTDNALHAPIVKSQDGCDDQLLPRFELPEVRHECPPAIPGIHPSLRDSYMRNR